MEIVYHHANGSRLNYKVSKGQPLHHLWNSLWEQCEEANENNSQRSCFPGRNTNLANVMKMLSVFQSEVKESSESKTSVKDLCEKCGCSKSKQKLLEVNYKKRGEIIEYLLSQSTAPLALNESLKNQISQFYLYNDNVGAETSIGTKEPSVIAGTQRPLVTDNPIIHSASLVTKGANNLVFHSFPHKEDIEEENIHGFKPNLENTGQFSGYHLKKENTTRTLVKFLAHFTKYDPSKDPFANMSVFENECSQYNLGPRESCLMMKLWLPSQMSARLSAPIASPAGGPQFWANDYHWGDPLDRLKAVTHLVTGEDSLGTDILEDLKVTSQECPWEFSRKFEQAYRLVMDLQDPKPPPALLKALVNKFNYVDRITHIAASKENTIEGILKLVDGYQRDNGLKAAPLWKYEAKSIKEVPVKDSIPDDEQPLRWRKQGQGEYS